MIRKEVKAALQKVSSSTDLPSYEGRNLTNVKSGVIIEELENTTLEEIKAIDELKRARQLRGDHSINSVSPNKKPTRVGVTQVGLSDIR